MQIIAYSAAILIVFAGVSRWVIKHDRRPWELVQIPNGVEAKGIILDFYKSGKKLSQPESDLDDVYRVLIRLQVTTENGDSWMTKTRKYVHESQLNMYHIGDTIRVKYDPENTNSVMVDCDMHLCAQSELQEEWH